ncbi:MAG: glycosyltransferase family 9 protein [Rhodospirillaceae bacterium]
MRGRILVIKLGALGDFAQALGPMQAIRQHHQGTPVDLLTTPPFAEIAEATGYFDRVMARGRMKWHEFGKIADLRQLLRGGGYDRVYDLQTSDRSSFYYRLFRPGPFPEWSGIARGCSHPHANPDRDRLHTIERQRDQLAMAGIHDVPPPDLSWAEADISRFGLDGPFALVAPGGAAHRSEKRWPADRVGALSDLIAQAGIAPVLIGGADEKPLHDAIRVSAPAARSLAGNTSLLELAALAKSARFAVGNDTGPMHLAAIAGIPTAVIYSHASDPALCAQRGPNVTILREPKTEDVAVDQVAQALGL